MEQLVPNMSPLEGTLDESHLSPVVIRNIEQVRKICGESRGTYDVLR